MSDLRRQDSALSADGSVHPAPVPLRPDAGAHTDAHTDVDTDADTVGRLGEDRVLSALREVIDAHNREALRAEAATQSRAAEDAAVGPMPVGPGDDAAVLQLADHRLVATTDTMSEGQDFRHRWWPDPAQAARSVGVKAAAQNLSDLSGMGARPTALLVSLTLPPSTAVSWAVGVMEGISEAASVAGAAGCLIAGGDLGSGETVSVTITALGRPAGATSLLRDGARPGDQLAVCGALGHAAAGLRLLESGLQAPEPTEGLGGGMLEACLRAQTYPAPDLTAGPRATAAAATAGMDVSDGLLRDAARLARASDVALLLDTDALREQAAALEGIADRLRPRTGQDVQEVPETQEAHPAPSSGALSEVAMTALRLVLHGGEDYALLATFPGGSPLPAGFRRIGEVRRHDGAPGVITGGTVERLVDEGWDSLRES
ncbi:MULTISPECIES: thiamine-phosphate kinase [Actinomycetes]|uniref:Thiamine-monophosphate kinase n=2 Tax=Actinomycetes TaxID=1760 RepID=A0ABP6LV71_9MICC